MSRIEKAKERIKQKPRDYTYKEATYLLEQMGLIKEKHLVQELCFIENMTNRLLCFINHTQAMR